MISTESDGDPRARQALRDAPTDKLARAVARERIRRKLFAARDQVTLGRYRLLDRAGAGGMGVVWSAWDPELERRVAIKVMRPSASAARERVLHEGQALARLSHPHVVPVYDVGVVDDQVYLVMEWVHGATLRAWASEVRPLREVVRAYREAAMGLAAAHDAGLVHRDFKPDNAMVGSADGRVRVLDFGLAQVERAEGIAGTPHYMAPEQRAGGEQTQAVDQYALGISLREALPDPAPAWLATIVARATAGVPGERFPSMHAVVAALAGDPARRLRRRAAAAGAIGLAGVAFAVGMKAGDGIEDRCTGEDLAWSPAALRGHLGTLGPYGAQLADRVVEDLAAYAKRTTSVQISTCRARDRGELSEAIYTTRLACVSRARASLVTAHEVLGATTRDRLPDALQATRSLPAVERCSSEVSPPPDGIATRVAENGEAVARARTLALAQDPRAIEAAASAARGADEIGDPRQIGRASLVHGLALLMQQQRAEAGTAFDRAARAALAADEPATAIEALARGLYASATNNQLRANPSDTVAKLDLALAIASGLEGDAAFARALLYNNLGTLHLGSDRAAARAWFEDAERVRPPATHATFELASIHGNLGMLDPDRTHRDMLLAREAAELEAALGADHPMTLDARIKAAMFVENPRRSAELLREACTQLARLHAHLVERVEQCSYELAWLAEERGDAREATEMLARISREVTPEGKLAAGYRELLGGKPADAARTMTELTEALSRKSGFWLRWRIVDAQLLAALAGDASGARDRAIAHAERALEALDALGDFTRSTFVQRRRGRLLAMLAQWNAGDVHARSAAALAWARLAGGYESRYGVSPEAAVRSAVPHVPPRLK